MKFITLVLLMMASQRLSAMRKMCTVELLRTFGYHSLIVPNKVNKLCPNIKLNCCTQHDQMRMHKLANSRIYQMRESLVYRKFSTGFLKIKSFFSGYSQIKMPSVMLEYQRLYPNLPDTLFEYMGKLQNQMRPHNSKIMNKVLTSFTKIDLKKIRKQKNHLR